jgi:hypothetical protein
MKALFWLRGAPARLTGHNFRPSEDLTLYEGMQRRFAVLTQIEPEVIEIGRIAKFWQPVPAEGPIVADRAAFDSFGAPGYVKAAMTFRLEPEHLIGIICHVFARVIENWTNRFESILYHIPAKILAESSTGCFR